MVTMQALVHALKVYLLRNHTTTARFPEVLQRAHVLHALPQCILDNSYRMQIYYCPHFLARMLERGKKKHLQTSKRYKVRKAFNDESQNQDSPPLVGDTPFILCMQFII